jgi:hypothetical protein
VATDDFNRSDGALGANWLQDTWYTGTPAIVSNQVPMNSSDCYQSYVGTFSEDQYSEITLDNLGSWSDDMPGVIVRHSISGGNTKFYSAAIAQYISGYLRINKFDEANAVYGTTLYEASAGVTIADGDVLRLEAYDEGGDVRLDVYLNGVLEGTYLDTSTPVTGGNPGFYLANKTSTGPTVDAWEGGDLSGGATGFDSALASQAAAIAGAVGVTANFTGALASAAASISGDVEATVSVDGALASPDATIVGAANQTLFVGALVAQDAVIAGDAEVTVDAEGAIVSDVATIAGASEVTVNAEGALASAASSIAGEYTAEDDNIPAEGALQSAVAIVAGEIEATVNAEGALSVASAAISGGVGVTISISGDLAVQAATILGEYTAEEIAVSGDVIAASASMAGAVGVTVNFDGAIQAEDADIFVDFPTTEPPLAFIAEMSSGPAGIAGVLTRFKADRTDVMLTGQRGRYRFRVRAR